ncbi:MAG: ABC transporter ATP-binding protein, partial [Spirochaetales bacterium]|nr:ABC transporter ATP-binding protein [Spirochaetales bacterium]
FLTILGTLFSVMGPKILGEATTHIVAGVQSAGKPGGGVDFGFLARLLAFLAGLYLVSSAFTWLQQVVMADITRKTVYRLRQDVESKLARLPLSFYDSHSHGDVLSRVTNDIDNISSTLQQSLTQLLSSLITLVGSLVLMLTINVWMTLIAVLTLPLMVLTTRGIAARSKKSFAEQQKALGELSGHVEEMYSGHRIIKAYGREEVSIERFEAINARLYGSGWRAQFVSGLIMPLMGFLNNIGYVAVCIAGGFLAAARAVTIGDIQAFLQYLRQFSMPIVQTANIVNVFQSSLASAERVFALLDETEETPDRVDSETQGRGEGKLIFEKVSFGYTPGVPVIEELDLSVQPGHVVAIVGPTGAGKTTLVNLLMRFYEIDKGSIKIDDVDIRHLRREALRSRFGMVLQDTWLFQGTIKENIAFGKEGAEDEEIFEAARAAHVDHFVRTMPEGWNTVLNEDVSNISQGQKQLLTIARALLADPDFLILDEATSNVDTRTERYIQSAMLALMHTRTSFVIAHRLSTIRDADLILVLEKGNVVEQGTHDELLKKNGAYAELYRSQFQSEVAVT